MTESMSTQTHELRMPLLVDGNNYEDISDILKACVDENIYFDLTIDLSEISKPELLDAWPFVRNALVSYAHSMKSQTHSLWVIGSKEIADSAPAGMGKTTDMENFLRKSGIRCAMRCELR
jgi:hypothetical protein